MWATLVMPMSCRVLVAKALRQPDPLPQLALMAVCTEGTGDHVRLLEAMNDLGTLVPATTPAEHVQAVHLRNEVTRIVEDTKAIMVGYASKKNNVVPFKGTLAAAKFLQDAIKAANREKPPSADKPGGSPSKESLEQQQENQVRRSLRERASRGSPKSKSTEWGPMRIDRLSMSVAVQQALAARRNRATDSGAVPRFIHRMAIDGRIFSHKARAPGGTVLIDASGSMQFSDQDIERILVAAPCATVAMYSGRRGGGGQLTVIAANGRRAEKSAIAETRNDVGLSNIVDGPALEWLAKQSEPRVWVSDAQVTGADEDFSLPLFANAMATVKEGRIQRLGNIERAVTEFERMAAGRKAVGDGEVKYRAA